MFHMGGDEVNFPCWSQEPKIVEWLKEKGFHTVPEMDPSGFLELWSLFQDNAKKRLIAANDGKRFKNDFIMWTSDLSKADVVTK